MRNLSFVGMAVLALSGCASTSMLANPGTPGSSTPGTSVNVPGAKSSQTGPGLMPPTGGQSSQH